MAGVWWCEIPALKIVSIQPRHETDTDMEDLDMQFKLVFLAFEQN